MVTALCLAAGLSWAQDLYAPREELAAALDLVYRARFAEAERQFQAIIDRYPDDPRGHEFLATSFDWWRKTCSGAPHGDDDMVALYETAADKARKIRGRNQKDLVALVSLGNARLRLTKKYRDKGEWFRTVGSGSAARSLLERARAANRANPDPKMGLGSINYYAANLPVPVKPFAFLLGFSGNRERGLAWLREAAETPGFYQIDAQYLLADIYSDLEGNPAAGLKWYETMRARYPDNPDFICSVEMIRARAEGRVTEHAAGWKLYHACRARHKNVCP